MARGVVVAVAHRIAVISGKGGVGKSTVSLNLALALAETGAKVGLLDADVYGPDIPVMVNLTRRAPLRFWDLASAKSTIQLEPVERFGIKIMSVGFLVGEQQALALPGPMGSLVLHQLTTAVDWGELDYLVIDFPPGASEVQQQLLGLLRPSGVLIVVSPQDVAHLDAKKVLDLLQRLSIPVLGGFENFSALDCPHCGEPVEVFPSVRAERSIWSLGVERLGRLPMDPAVARAAETGRPLLVADPDSPPVRAFRQLASVIIEAL
ncbi:MAG: P-loop NTPase [Egibacteraceae bacterium]